LSSTSITRTRRHRSISRALQKAPNASRRNARPADRPRGHDGRRARRARRARVVVVRCSRRSVARAVPPARHHAHV
jgi:hypothetical protein